MKWEKRNTSVLLVRVSLLQLYVYCIMMKNLFVTNYHTQKKFGKSFLKHTVFSPATEPQQMLVPLPGELCPNSLPGNS